MSNRSSIAFRSAALGSLTCIVGLSATTPAQAVTQCQSHVSQLWAGSGGELYIYLTNGGIAVISPNDGAREAALAISMTAITASRQVIMRYAADNVDCATQRTDFVGMYLL